MSDTVIMLENGSASKPDMGNKHTSPHKSDDGEMTNGHGELSDASDTTDYKYVSIIDVNPTSPHYQTALEESIHQTIEVNSPVRVNGDVPSIRVNGENQHFKVNGDISNIEVNNPESGEVLNCSLVVVKPVENGHSVSRVSINGEDMLETPNKTSGSPSNIQNSNSFVDLTNLNASLSVSSISQQASSGNGVITSTSTPYTKRSSQENEELNESFSVKYSQDLGDLVHNNNNSIFEKSFDGLTLDEEVVSVLREKLKRQRSGSSDCWTNEDNEEYIVDFLGKSTDHAEARLAAKRQARAEAREIRMRELERLQRESEDNDKVYDVYSSPDGLNRSARAGSVTTQRSNNSCHWSRRSSEDSLEEVNSIRDVRMELKECEDKFRKAMVANAQLDNEKAALSYQVDLLKDKFEELEEQHLQLTREHKETNRQLEQTKRHRNQLQDDLKVTRTQLEELLQLIQEKGLVVVEGEEEEDIEDGDNGKPKAKPPKKALVSAEVADVLQQGSGSLDVRLKRFVEERNELVDELRRVKLELEEERSSRGRHANGPSDDQDDIQREATKLLGDYKFKLQKAEQDVNTLQATVARLESQVIRYKSAAETSEKLEDELKSEKRKLQRELREAQARVEELETSHSHLQRRLDKLKNAKSALFKDL